MDVQTRTVRQVKSQVKCLPCLHISNRFALKIVETYAYDIRYGGILKQVKDDKEKIISFTFKH